MTHLERAASPIRAPVALTAVVTARAFANLQRSAGTEKAKIARECSAATAVRSADLIAFAPKPISQDKGIHLTGMAIDRAHDDHHAATRYRVAPARL